METFKFANKAGREYTVLSCADILRPHRYEVAWRSKYAKPTVAKDGTTRLVIRKASLEDGILAGSFPLAIILIKVLVRVM